MKLLFVRHATADQVLHGPTSARPHRSGTGRVADSPLPRARATADIGARAFRRIEPALAGERLDEIVAARKTHPRDATVAIVGHEPMLGALLAQMLGSTQAARLAFKKGDAALEDLTDGPKAPGRLIWFLDPRVLRTLADASGITRKVPNPNGRSRREENPS
jgi:phosphohistidine phosphatase SixA